METPKASIIKLNPDCEGTHCIQSEIDELQKLAEASSHWKERFEEAAQANARLEAQASDFHSHWMSSEKINEDLELFLARCLPFAEFLAHRIGCESPHGIPCINCEANKFLVDYGRNRRKTA